MDLQTAKIKNYLIWLKRRGQRLISVRPMSAHMRQVEPASYYFLDDKRGGELAGQELLRKIARAMGLNASDYIVQEWSKADYANAIKAPVKAFIALGRDAAQVFERPEFDNISTPCLSIPHPLEMIASPELKRETWTKLQNLMKVTEAVQTSTSSH